MNAYKYIQQQVDILCAKREIPMHPSLVEEVKKVYEEGLSLENESKDTPLMLASEWGFECLVWGFIQCAKQSDTNLHTGEPLDLQEFLGYRNLSGQTIFHVAAPTEKYLIVFDLLDVVSVDHFISYRDKSGKTPISLLEVSDWYDLVILNFLKAAASKGDYQVDNPTKSILLPADDKAEVYTDIEMDPNSRPTSHTNNTWESLTKLDKGKLELTKSKSTILHLVCEFGDTDYAKVILERHPSLIYNRNIEGETPFYVAAREGHIDMLEILITYAHSDKIKQLATRSKDRNTALHVAIQEHHVGVVFWLVKRIPQLANHVNDLQESPLYLAADNNFHAIVTLILDHCKERAYNGPDGKTALHAAEISDCDGYGKREQCTRTLLQANIDLLKDTDKDGWTPLHYAAKFDRSSIIGNLIEERTHNIGNQMTSRVNIITSAFRIADTKGRNMLHVAIEYKNIDIIKLVFKDELIISLINQQDNSGNTPLHLLMASELEMEGIIVDARFNINVRNNQKCTPLHMASSDDKRERLKEAMEMLVGEHGKPRRLLWEDLEEEITSYKCKREKEQEQKKQKKKRVFAKIGDNVVLVVTLIATASFAAAFAVPGGFDGNEGLEQGMPILLKKAAYKAFVMANALAFSCSCTVLFGYIRLQLDDAGEQEKDGYDNIISLQYLLTGIALVAMAVAFVTGTYVILTPSLGLAISACTMCLCIMVPLSIFPRKRLGFASAILRKLT